jgi:hypothetical protein
MGFFPITGWGAGTRVRYELSNIRLAGILPRRNKVCGSFNIFLLIFAQLLPALPFLLGRFTTKSPKHKFHGLFSQKPSCLHALAVGFPYFSQ